MSGIYIHIPFCKKACSYCNFHFSTTYHKYRDKLINSLLKEIKTRTNYLDYKEITSIYFGGGTPSLLNETELVLIFNELNKYYIYDSNKIEITLEANPDDLNLEKLKMLKRVGINRLSIGIQSFHKEDLVLMNRSHNSKQAYKAIENSIAVGFNNFSIDLIFGIPNSTQEKWQENLNIVNQFNIPHISVYNLTVEPKTKIFNDITKNKYLLPTDSVASNQFYQAKEFLVKNGYLHYEISNYAKKNRIAIHNTNYWKSISYIGIGPGAHSFNGNSRQWNISNNTKYIKSINNNTSYYDLEVISDVDKYNEYIITGLRTIWGCNLTYIMQIDIKLYHYFLKQSAEHIKNKNIIILEDIYVLSDAGLMISDHIISDLFFV